MTVVLATGNPGKAAELKEILGVRGIGAVSLAEVLKEAYAEPEETGITFEENALIKARAASGATGMIALADDSGLEVAALGGRPGVYSSRYDGSDKARIEKLLRELSDVPDSERGAKFVCALALVYPGKPEPGEAASGPREWAVRGESHGVILRTPRGSGGFGYDPVFYHEGLRKTFAEASEAEKNAVSHRAAAFAEFDRLLPICP